ncbi:MAG: hypothetical protein H6741_03260 [Alphaproteobacteria bacterium]|nr:hypothetical protein [Alphaproteobacteria bacterium]
MAELRFSRSLYDAAAVRGAVAAFSRLATLSLSEQESELVVEMKDPHPAYADRLADELANYALGATAAAHIRGGAP